MPRRASASPTPSATFPATSCSPANVLWRRRWCRRGCPGWICCRRRWTCPAPRSSWSRCRSAPTGPTPPSTAPRPGARAVAPPRAECELAEMPERPRRLGTARDGAAPGRWDVCLIDCPPSLGLLTINALVAAQSILVPLQTEFFALEGLSQLLQTIERIRARFNPELSILGVALAMFDKRNNLSAQVADAVRGCPGKGVCGTVIPRNVRLSEAPSHGIPALIYDQRCSGSEAYMQLARELISRSPQRAEAA